MVAKLESQILSRVTKVPKIRMGGFSSILGLVLLCLLLAQPVQSSDVDNNRMRKFLPGVQPSYRSHFPSIITRAAAGDTVFSEWKIGELLPCLFPNIFPAVS